MDFKSVDCGEKTIEKHKRFVPVSQEDCKDNCAYQCIGVVVHVFNYNVI